MSKYEDDVGILDSSCVHIQGKWNESNDDVHVDLETLTLVDDDVGRSVFLNATDPWLFLESSNVNDDDDGSGESNLMDNNDSLEIAVLESSHGEGNHIVWRKDNVELGRPPKFWRESTTYFS